MRGVHMYASISLTQDYSIKIKKKSKADVDERERNRNLSLTHHKKTNPIPRNRPRIQRLRSFRQKEND